jgi:hypothetical protein
LPGECVRPQQAATFLLPQQKSCHCALSYKAVFSIRATKYRISRPIRRTMIFSFEILEKKKDDECILILVIYWKKTGLLHVLLEESKPFTSSDAKSHDLEANFTISR